MTAVQLIGHDGSNISEANWESVFGGFLEGPFQGVANECEVIASAPAAMTVEVRTGTLVSGGVFGQVTAQHLLTIAASDPVNDRIDRIVARRTNATNTFELAVLTGTPAGAPVPNALTRAGGVYEISLAQVLVQATVVQINTADITDERSDYSVCGYARSKSGRSITILDRDLTQATAVADTTEQSLYSFTIPANILGTTGGIRLTLGGDYFHNAGGDERIIWRIKLGATTVLASSTGAGGYNSSAQKRKWSLTIWFLNNAAFNSQKWSAKGVMSGAAPEDMPFDPESVSLGEMAIAGGYGTSAEDTFGALVLEVTLQHAAVKAGNFLNREMAVLELLPAA